MSSSYPRSVSIVIPAKNEEGHIERIFQEMPHFCEDMELIFIEGDSTDNTWNKLKQAMNRYGNTWNKLTLLKQDGHGKADAVWKGIASATGDIIFILDADLTVPPSALTDLYKPFVDGTATFTYGTRYVHPMEKGAMRFWNNLANRIFALAWQPLFRQKVTDSLCGTKVFLRKDYEEVRRNHPKIFDADRYGDFALFFIAPAMRCKIIEVPVHYRARRYGSSNIPRWQGGVRLMRVYLMCVLALLKRR